jgi:hypothetical protein
MKFVKNSKPSLIFFSIIFIGVFYITACEKKNADVRTETVNRIEDSKPENNSVVNSSDCDTSLWARVYNPERLEVYNKCVTVTGVIEESAADADGDQHMLLRLDKGYESYINSRNEKKKDGCLVIEAVCVNEVKKKKVGKVCEGYINNVLLPGLGSHVNVTGSFVNDSHNGWNEIHPITKIEILN